MLRVRNIIIGCWGFLFAIHASHSWAASEFDIELQKLIDQCWALSQEQRDSGVTAEMVMGTHATEKCFQDNSMRLAKDLYKDPGNWKQFFVEPLFRSIQAQRELIRKISEWHDHCVPTCGTIQAVIQAGQMAYFQQDIFEAVFRNHWHYVLRK